MALAETNIREAPTIFISYRRSDSPAAARQLADALRTRFGADRVFFDTHDLPPGADWRSQIEARVRSADVFVAVIGPRWVAIADERGRRRVTHPEEEDVVRMECEAAIRCGCGIVPVLVDDAVLPARGDVPRPFRPILTRNAVALRHASWKRDLEALSDALARFPLPTATPAAPVWEPPPGERHYRRVAQALMEGVLVPVIGAGVHADGAAWRKGCGRLPDAAELAGALVERFRLGTTSRDLAEVAQQVMASEGPAPLERALRELVLDETVEPGPIHVALANLTGRLRAADAESFPLVVSATYDTALERAFERAGEQFDLAVLLPARDERGLFLHLPWYSTAEADVTPIESPNEYVEFPVDEAGRLSRTIILKVHGGALYDAPRGLGIEPAFVVTEDDYIGLLSDRTAEGFVPTQLLRKLRGDHFLFLGYGVREWTLRVFLRRVWPEGKPGARSWAVQADADEIDDDVWGTLEVDRFDAEPRDYLAALEQCLRR